MMWIQSSDADACGRGEWKIPTGGTRQVTQQTISFTVRDGWGWWEGAAICTDSKPCRAPPPTRLTPRYPQQNLPRRRDASLCSPPRAQPRASPMTIRRRPPSWMVTALAKRRTVPRPLDTGFILFNCSLEDARRPTPRIPRRAPDKRIH